MLIINIELGIRVIKTNRLDLETLNGTELSIKWVLERVYAMVQLWQLAIYKQVWLLPGRGQAITPITGPYCSVIERPRSHHHNKERKARWHVGATASLSTTSSCEEIGVRGDKTECVVPITEWWWLLSVSQLLIMSARIKLQKGKPQTLNLYAINFNPNPKKKGRAKNFTLFRVYNKTINQI